MLEAVHCYFHQAADVLDLTPKVRDILFMPARVIKVAFVEEDDVFAVWEQAVAATFREVMNVELETPFVRMPYGEAMERFGSDKPDIGFSWTKRSRELI